MKLISVFLLGLYSGKQRVAKRDAASNPLVIEPLGRIGSRTLYHLDDSPRVYSSLVDIEHFPATDDWLAYDEERLVWRALSSSVEQYERVLGELPEPDRQVQEQRRIALEAFNVAQEAEINAASALQQQVQASGGGAASKKKGKSGAAAAAAAAASSTLQQNLNATGVAVRAAAKALTKPAKLWQEQSDEQLTRYKLEEDLEDVKEFQKVRCALITMTRDSMADEITLVLAGLRRHQFEASTRCDSPGRQGSSLRSFAGQIRHGLRRRFWILIFILNRSVVTFAHATSTSRLRL